MFMRRSANFRDLDYMLARGAARSLSTPRVSAVMLSRGAGLRISAMTSHTCRREPAYTSGKAMSLVS